MLLPSFDGRIGDFDGDFALNYDEKMFAKVSVLNDFVPRLITLENKHLTNFFDDSRLHIRTVLENFYFFYDLQEVVIFILASFVVRLPDNFFDSFDFANCHLLIF